MIIWVDSGEREDAWHCDRTEASPTHHRNSGRKNSGDQGSVSKCDNQRSRCQ